MARRVSLAIVGGGFSGTMLAVQLIRKAMKPFGLTVFDASGNFAKGAAYGTRDLSHLLNVPTGKMSAFSNNPTHLTEWLTAHGAQWRAAFPALTDTRYDAASFLPRALYGFYLSSLLEDAVQEAARKGINLTLRPQEVTAAEYRDGRWLLKTRSGDEATADLLALATGNSAARDFEVMGEASEARYIRHLWSASGENFLRQADFPDSHDPVVILGSGLTAVDAVLSLSSRDPAPSVIIISRHAMLPRPHAAASQSWTIVRNLSTIRTMAGKLRALRAEIADAASQAIGWEAVIDALRPQTAALWKGLSRAQQHRFLHRLWNIWNVHRHRMPRNSHESLSALELRGKLTCKAGRILSIDAANPDALIVHWQPKGGNSATLRARAVVNCTGPELQLAHLPNPLLRNLIMNGALTPHPLGIGAALEESGDLSGNAGRALFAIGPLLIGEKLETTAVPELRVQAEALAERLLVKMQRMSAC